LTEPLPVITHQAELPSTSLRYAECGDGPSLIIVPATISLIEDWTPMVQFVAQCYRTYFFEMPGHGGSAPLEEGFTSTRLAGVIGELADHVGAERFALLGFRSVASSRCGRCRRTATASRKSGFFRRA